MLVKTWVAKAKVAPVKFTKWFSKYRIGVVSSPVCSFCEKENESLEHMFIHCNYTEEFWAQVNKWLRSSNVNINNLKNKEIMLGMPNCEDELFVNDVVILSLQKNVSYI